MPIHIEIPDRELYFCGPVNLDAVKANSLAITDINEKDKKIKQDYVKHGISYNPSPINLRIDSYGGYVYQCLGLANIIKYSDTPVTTIVGGCAMSAAFILALCGHKRVAYKDSTFMYHQIFTHIAGEAQRVEEEMKETSRLQEILESIVLDKTKITKSKLKEIKASKQNWYLDAKEALKLGIIDQII